MRTLLSPLADAIAQVTLPRPHGWIGTVSDWLVGLGIASALLDVVLLAFAWESLRTGTITPITRGWLLVAVGLVPIMVVFVSFSSGSKPPARC